MALATGVEAPSSAIAQLGQLDDDDRRRFARITLWLTLGVVGTLTLGLTATAVHLRVGVPETDSTQIADLARVPSSGPVVAAFRCCSRPRRRLSKPGPACSRPWHDGKTAVTR